MEFLKLLVALGFAWLGWRYLKARHGSPQPPKLKPAIQAERAALKEKCRALLSPGALTGNAAAYLLLDLRAASISAKDANLHVLEGELETALEDRTITPREAKELRFWIATACDDDATLPAHLGGVDDDDDDAADDFGDENSDEDAREAYLLENSTLSADGRYTFDYEDGRGNQSSRRVDILYVDGDYIEAYDHDANGMRTFRKTRIHGDVTDLETGELLSAKSINRKRLGIKKIDFESLDL